MPWLGEIYVCLDCDYRGALIVEDFGGIAEALKNKFEKEDEEKEGST